MAVLHSISEARDLFEKLKRAEGAPDAILSEIGFNLDKNKAGIEQLYPKEKNKSRADVQDELDKFTAKGHLAEAKKLNEALKRTEGDPDILLAEIRNRLKEAAKYKKLDDEDKKDISEIRGHLKENAALGYMKMADGYLNKLKEVQGNPESILKSLDLRLEDAVLNDPRHKTKAKEMLVESKKYAAKGYLKEAEIRIGDLENDKGNAKGNLSDIEYMLSKAQALNEAGKSAYLNDSEQKLFKEITGKLKDQKVIVEIKDAYKLSLELPRSEHPEEVYKEIKAKLAQYNVNELALNTEGKMPKYLDSNEKAADLQDAEKRLLDSRTQGHLNNARKDFASLKTTKDKDPDGLRLKIQKSLKYAKSDESALYIDVKKSKEEVRGEIDKYSALTYMSLAAESLDLIKEKRGDFDNIAKNVDGNLKKADKFKDKLDDDGKQSLENLSNLFKALKAAKSTAIVPSQYNSIPNVHNTERGRQH